MSDMDEYIKRSEVVGLIEDKLKRCETVLEALDLASLRTKVMGLRSADVAPRAEVAREILAEIKEKGSFSDPCVQHIVLSFDELAEIEKKYTEAEPPKGE